MRNKKNLGKLLSKALDKWEKETHPMSSWKQDRARLIRTLKVALQKD